MRSGKASILNVIFGVIIALVVVAILLPLIPPHERARKATCQHNLKICSQALRMYSDDWNGQLPSSYVVSQSKRWNTLDYVTFGTTLGTLPPERGTQKRTWPQVLYGNAKYKDIFFCPSDGADAKDPTSRLSYWYKLANDKAWYGVGCPKPRRAYTDYAFTADQIAIYERLGWHFNDQNGLHNGVQINAAFMDTHVETIVFSNATSGDPINCAANSDGEPMYYNHDTETNRQATGPAKYTDPTRYSDKL